MIVEHLTYDTLAERYDTAIFTENQTKQDFTKAGEKLKKHIYDYVVTDSKVERNFVTELDTSTEVVVYAKLPRGFFIPTPVGDYNPDWAIAFKEGTVKHVYFVAETKGSLSTLQLKGAEEAKIACARRFFASLNGRNGGGVKVRRCDGLRTDSCSWSREPGVKLVMRTGLSVVGLIYSRPTSSRAIDPCAANTTRSPDVVRREIWPGPPGQAKS